VLFHSARLSANSLTITNASSSSNKTATVSFADLMMIELGTDAAKLVSAAPLLPEEGWTRFADGVVGDDGMPITADNIFRQIKGKMMQEI